MVWFAPGLALCKLWGSCRDAKKNSPRPALPFLPMDFDWLNVNFDLSKIPPKEIEESFEDPFSMRMLPEGNDEATEARYFSLGKSLANRAIFSVFWTDGKRYRVILSREMSDGELSFYERKKAELL
jgi:uncharacterized DUF497 family protein